MTTAVDCEGVGERRSSKLLLSDFRFRFTALIGMSEGEQTTHSPVRTTGETNGDTAEMEKWKGVHRSAGDIAS